MSFPKPLIKWLGGKTQLLPKLTEEFPTSMNNYHEIFIGGGSVLLALLTLKLNGTIRVEGTIFAYDANEPLIHLYKNVQSYPNELFAMIQTIITQMNLCLELESQEEKSRKRPTTLEEGLTSKENYYYWIRHQYNTLTHDEKKSLQGSSMFLFLNKTCFRGLFRLNSSGKYNVPYGHYKTPEIINLLHLLEISTLIHHVVF